MALTKDKKILIVGLGLIGGSYAEGLSKKGFEAGGIARRQETLDYALAHGADIKTVQTRLGHANASLTLNQYAHAVPANDRNAADLMGTLFNVPAQPQGEMLELKTA